MYHYIGTWPYVYFSSSTANHLNMEILIHNTCINNTCISLILVYIIHVGILMLDDEAWSLIQNLLYITAVEECVTNKS